MSGGALAPDRIVALIGVVLAMVLVSRSQRLRAMPGRQRLLLGAVWAVIFGVVAGLAAMMTRGSL